MFVRASTLFLAIAASVIAVAADALMPASQCDTGNLKCCDQTFTAAEASGLLGIPIDVLGLVGIDCSALNVIGISGTSCTAQPVCCTNVVQKGLVNVGCSPIDLGS